MYTAFPDTISATESNKFASTRFDSEPFNAWDAYFVMEFVNFVEVVLDDDDEDEGTEASELFFFRYWYDICTSSLLLYSLTLSLFLSLSLSTSRARYKNFSLGGKPTLKNFKTSQTSSSRVVVSLSLSLSSWKKKDGNTNENKNSLDGGTTFVAFKIVEKEEESEWEFKKQKKTPTRQSRIF